MTSLPARMRNRVRTEARLAWGRATAVRRQKPDFVLIGTMRAGTTSLFRDLKRHPQMLAPVTKEIHYFDYHHGKGERWYLAHFPTDGERSAVRNRHGAALSGEATPNYLAHPFAPRWAAEELPDARFVVLLRDPVARAFSHWKLMTRIGHETLPFAEAVAREAERTGPAWERLAREPHYPAVDWFRHAYAGRGYYAEQLARWFDAVGRDRILVVRSEDYYAEPEAVWEKITGFVGLSGWNPGNFSKAHGTAARGIDPDVTARLRAVFAAPNAALADLLGRDLGWPS